MLVNESSQGLKEVITHTGYVEERIAQLTTIDREQLQNTEQLTLAIKQLEEMTRRNVPFVKKTVAISQFLDEQNRGLQELVTFFDLGVGTDSNQGAAQLNVPMTRPSNFNSKGSDS
jgi:methyl-accepting chemotaxis protein